MSLSLTYPIIKYFFFIWIFIIFTPNFLRLIPKKSTSIDLIHSVCNYIIVLGTAILTSFFIIFFNSAGYLLNLELLFNIFLIAHFIYVLNYIVKNYGKKVVIVNAVTPFLISFVIFYFLFNGEKIYKLSPHCENTNDPEIKYCVYENGTYTGELKAFKRHGEGIYNWNSGSVYVGEWKNGLMDGSGEMTRDGKKIKGKWKKHKRISG